MPSEPNSNEEEVRRFLETLVSKLSGYRRPISDDTSLWHDIGIYGDDAWKLFEDIKKHFGTKFPGTDVDYFPSEGEITFRSLGRLFGLQDKRPRLTFGHLIVVIRQGQWFEPP